MAISILVAEDYDDTREFMMFTLASHGYEVLPAENGQEALDIARANHPDLILMDISMPVMNGLQATEMIRATDDYLAQIPIIAVTAYDSSFKQKSLEAGCNEVIPKPVDLDALNLTIEQYLN